MPGIFQYDKSSDSDAKFAETNYWKTEICQTKTRRDVPHPLARHRGRKNRKGCRGAIWIFMYLDSRRADTAERRPAAPRLAARRPAWPHRITGTALELEHIARSDSRQTATAHDHNQKHTQPLPITACDWSSTTRPGLPTQKKDSSYM
ncbi:hypothetical protein EVAR_46931_1 [Eumeta japonica]|uniref:Uncharacterized protein n=1 Tax=Eumeta variegata TaxID=151549 RepID=A0A4C1ZYX0_EUMVA|nr:hypothetical protein EVAR_46931_1 [Eumeta japonica]